MSKVRVNGVLAKILVARQEYGCDECLRTIHKGDEYLYVNAFWPRRVCKRHGVAA